jgi:cell division protease FtsH
MILEWGMSKKLGFVNYAGVDTREAYVAEKEYSDDTARIIDQETKRLIDEAYADAEQMLSANWDKVEAVAEALLKYETLVGKDIERIMSGERLDKPTVAELLEQEAKSSTRPRPSKPAPKDDLGDEPAGGVVPHPA